ncbi:MAG: nucleoside-diphosphate kinase [Salinivirgaceae bacterium]|nr:nucleoside-diphosphate kinase [Salinivirgaceae bacterium]MDD4746336.1 nucleoside-diphosphate kinase [Salinivirgaceae bacterium]MDY0280363.1 nucleoside-diphosphate kinase [Salinivirgaceae bacterium]
MRDIKGQITLAIIKPAAVARNFSVPILSHIDEAGFHIAAMKMVWLTRNEARTFYNEHREKPFFPELIDFMTSGPIIALILERPQAVELFRNLIGNTNPEKAEEGTLRNLFAESITKNAVHGSDSDDSAMREADFFFARMNRYYKHDLK